MKEKFNGQIGTVPLILDHQQDRREYDCINVGVGYSDPKTTTDSQKGREDRAPTLGNIIAYFKYQSTKQINNVGAGLFPPHNGFPPPIYPKIFQRNYYEHIIRNEIELEKIREYIMLNPAMWDRDRNNPDNF